MGLNGAIRATAVGFMAALLIATPAAAAEPRLIKAESVFGADDRVVKDAFLSDAERRFYSGVGVVRCLAKNATVNISTAFQIGSYSTLVSTAHGFYSPRKRQRVKASGCSVIFYDAAGQAIEIVRVRKIFTRWDQPGRFGDDTQDLAILSLRKESRTPRHHYLYRAGQPLTEPVKVVMVGFHYEVDNPTVLRKVTGVAQPPPESYYHARSARRRGESYSNPQFVAVADYDSSQGTSGGPVFDPQGRVIGINKGTAGGYSRVFDPRSNYTYVVMFDGQFEADLKAMADKR